MGGWGLVGSEHKGTFWKEGNVFYLNCVGLYMGVCIYRNSQIKFSAAYCT